MMLRLFGAFGSFSHVNRLPEHEPRKPLHTSQQIMDFVKQADYDAIEGLKIADLPLLFRRVLQLDGSGQTQAMSPLEHAFRTFDTRMWKLIRDKTYDQLDLQDEFCRQAFEGITEQGMEAIRIRHEHSENEAIEFEHLSHREYQILQEWPTILERNLPFLNPHFETLLTAYDHYQKQDRRFEMGEISKKVSEEEWRIFARTQKRVLPHYMHLMKEFSRKENDWLDEDNDYWADSASFNVLRLPPPRSGSVYVCDPRKWAIWTSLASIIQDPSWGWGTEFPLLRGGGGRISAGDPYFAGAIRMDETKFRTLYEGHKAKWITLLLELWPRLQQLNSQKQPAPQRIAEAKQEEKSSSAPRIG